MIEAIEKAERRLIEKRSKKKNITTINKFMNKNDRHKIVKVLITQLLEVVIKIEVKDNNIEQALRVLKRKLQRDGFFKVIKLKNTYEKPSEKKKRILQENIKRVKKLNKLKNRI